ncbi:type VI secretion system membrane subunit TssM [Rhodovulum kholense]|uniref:Type VI secretion system protein ImpL n=1 Tax=Rhodovulum kholense TaxID=453584 RepID=A0A8E3AQS8_9RHOB|nr:type VI secretion system membrane subunit TssM [Rhodovulum kholense]PTW46560.1 type VI secretion system protein ImpL [Rhodovulum kholense]
MRRALRAVGAAFAAMWRARWMRVLLIVLGLVALGAAIWFGLPMTGSALLASVWFRVGLIALIAGTLGLVYGLGWLRRRRRAEALEDSLMAEPAGDGRVLAERMQQALAKLRRSGGKSALYDLPWYVIIGPPGAGKTTALANSGIGFPGQDGPGSGVEGFGGTRNCDWWFAEEAVLIDTAGRYTTQDSDAEADRASWTSFLQLLKKGRPDQPVNGVILAFSVADMMTASEADLTRHAETVRSRLAELHETLKIDVPVYVLFTKADLISGFREYFGSFSQSRRRLVWGTTFQTRDRSARTCELVPAEFDALVARLSDEVSDRMTEEPDGAARIAIFGLPGQMAMLRDTVSDFLRRVFAPTRYQSNAILRGFYFTSGTQEGTPIDQVLGAMAKGGDEAAFQPAFLSGKGRSYFLHDLLKKVIFEERDWVGFDRRAVRRRQILRSAAMVLIAAVTLGGMAGFGYSFWQNASLLAAADADAAAYRDAARNELARTVIDDPDASVVLPQLQRLRQMTAGYVDPRRPGLFEGLGLSRHDELHAAADRAYSDGLERMLRPRLILALENSLPQLIAEDDTAAIYRALKVYLLLGGQGGTRGAEDDAVVAGYFDEIWRARFAAPGEFRLREELTQHLEAMLDLDGDRRITIGIDPEIVRKARDAIVTLPLADQAYASIRDRALTSGLPAFAPAEAIGGQVERVLATTDGTPLDSLSVPGLYTFEGYWGFFLDELTNARARLKDDRWVLGEAADRVDYDRQLGSLERDLHRRYRQEFDAAWTGLLSRLTLARMSADPPRYDALAAAASPVDSPLARLVEEIGRQTRLSRLYDEIDAMAPEDAAKAAAGGDLAGNMGDAAFSRIYSRSGVFQRVVLDAVQARGKSQVRAGAVSEDSQRAQVQRISDDFADWQRLLTGEPGARPIDAVLANLAALRENRRNAALAPSPADETLLRQTLSALTMNNSALPPDLGRMLSAVEAEFRSEAQDASLGQIERAMNDEVGAFCREFIEPYFPFTEGGRHVSPAIFGQFFAPGGRADRFFTTYLQPHVTRGPDGLEPVPGSSIGERLSPDLLKAFDRIEAIRMAFFASGASEPRVDMAVTHISSSPSVNLAVLAINGSELRTQPGSTPGELSWPGPGSGVSLGLFPQQSGRPNGIRFDAGRWDIVTFLRTGRSRVNGTSVEVTQDVGGRSITYRFSFDSTTVPFLMPELAQFSCPVSVEDRP